MKFAQDNIGYDIAKLIELEVSRLSCKYGKEYLDCADLMKILGVGRDNTRTLMRRDDFPVVTIGRRKVVSVLNFVLWQLGKDNLTYSPFRANM